MHPLTIVGAQKFASPTQVTQGTLNVAANHPMQQH